MKLNLIIIKLQNTKRYHEYQFTYLDDKKQIRGIVDLLAIYKDEVQIINYKLKKIDDNKQYNQLLTYKN